MPDQTEANAAETQASEETLAEATEQYGRTDGSPLPSVAVPSEAPEQLSEQPSPAELKSEVAKQLRESEERTRQFLAQQIERIKQSQRSTTKAGFGELKESIKELYDTHYHAAAAGVDELVQKGKLDPTDAAIQKMEWRDRYDRAALQETQKRVQEQERVGAQLGGDAALSGADEFETLVPLILDEYDLSMSDPEYQSDIASKPLGASSREAELRLRKLAKQAAKKKEARLSGKSTSGEQNAPKKPTPADTATAQRVPPPLSPEEELKSLNNQEPPEDPKKAKLYWRRIQELTGTGG